METQNSCCDKPVWLQIIVAVGGVILTVYLIILARNAWKQYDYIGKSEEFPHTIMITGKGKVLSVPDIATVSLGLETEKSTVSQAQEENTKKMNKLLQELNKLQIAKEDIATTQYNVYPQYDWRDNKQTLRAYAVMQNITVKIRSFEKIPGVLQLVGSLELNQVNGLNFTVDDPEKLQQEARIAAIKNAREKAKALAKEAGVKLGRVISFSEDYNQPYPIMYSKESAMASGIGGGGAMPPQIEPGSQEINVQINISYEIL